MIDWPDTPILRKVKQDILGLVDRVESLAVQLNAYHELAKSKGVDDLEIGEALQSAMNDPAKMQAARKQYAAMRQALVDSGIEAFQEGLLLDLPLPEKPN
jgi:hypothetical protein